VPFVINGYHPCETVSPAFANAISSQLFSRLFCEKRAIARRIEDVDLAPGGNDVVMGILRRSAGRHR
jgi:hypothetical protein